MSDSRISRRACLSRTLYICAYGGLFGPLLACGGESILDRYRNPALWRDVPKGYVSSVDLDAAQDIGAAYLEENGRDHDLQTLQNAVSEASTLLSEDRPSTDRLMALQQAINEDFENNATVTVAGWVLSRTEAQLCALLFLNRGVA